MEPTTYEQAELGLPERLGPYLWEALGPEDDAPIQCNWYDSVGGIWWTHDAERGKYVANYPGPLWRTLLATPCKRCLRLMVRFHGPQYEQRKEVL